MACCLLAAFLIAQAVAVLHRWAVFWGLARPWEGEAADTIFTRAKLWFARPAVRMVAAAVLAIELIGGGTWLYAEHGAHIYQEADRIVSNLRGERVIYAGACTPAGSDGAVRIVLNDPHRPAFVLN